VIPPPPRTASRFGRLPGPARQRSLRQRSLRARLLGGLIAVIAIFLIVMGTVSTAVLGKLESDQFTADLRLTARESPAQIAAARDGYVAASLSVATGDVIQLTPDSAAGEELVAVLTAMAATPRSRAAAFAEAQKRRDMPFSVHPPASASAAGPGASAAGPGPGGSSSAARTTASRVVATPSGQQDISPGTGGPALQAVWRPVSSPAGLGATLPRGENVMLVARPVSAVSSQVRGLVAAELITGAALLALLALFGNWLIARGLAPLGRMARTADRITDRGDLTERMPTSAAGDRHEAGRLAAAINTMLDRIQQSFADRLRSEEKVRQFAADASHEMRTPLTTIRGYAELYRQGAIGPAELPTAMRRIEQEAERMSRLVAELLELARLDRTSSLDLTETDLAELVRDAVADALAVEPERPVRARLPREPVIVTADEPRLRQVLANLLGNVAAHTPPGTPATVTLREDSTSAVLEVADEGPGMPAADAARAFDRFHRAGPTTSTGSGLGLSIVAAIATAHGGRARLTSVPGQGTTVEVTISLKTEVPFPERTPPGGFPLLPGTRPALPGAVVPGAPSPGAPGP
jgi:two-component system OmpR family sensor kinase